MMNFVKFVPAGDEDRKTVYHIFLPNIEARVGEIRWHDKAQRYVFFPQPHLWLDCSGLRMIAEFCEKKTKDLLTVV